MVGGVSGRGEVWGEGRGVGEECGVRGEVCWEG